MLEPRRENLRTSVNLCESSSFRRVQWPHKSLQRILVGEAQCGPPGFRGSEMSGMWNRAKGKKHQLSQPAKGVLQRR